MRESDAPASSSSNGEKANGRANEADLGSTAQFFEAVGDVRDKVQSHVVSRERVAEHGEVLTGLREVNAMLDLVKQETQRIESRFLEPACGNGNFLAEVLTRKLTVVENRYGKSQREYERYAVLAVSSIYGIDILEDNVRQCRSRLLGSFESPYRRLFRSSIHDDCLASVRFILEHNILWGNTLTLNTAGAHPVPIVFSEWSPVNASQIKRREFSFHRLLGERGLVEPPLRNERGEDVFIPAPQREYPLTHFLDLSRAG
jgi:hypothetical protein